MVRLLGSLKPFVAALLVLLMVQPLAAQSIDVDEVDRLLSELAKPEQPGWEQIEDSIVREWSRSGSPAMDLLLQRGQAAMNDGDMAAAVEHLTALTDHAPDFAEGWHARATAFFHMQEYGLSVADIEQTLRLNPRHFGALSGLAVIFEELGYDDEALELFRAVHAIHPHRPTVKEAIDRLEKTVEGERI